MELLLILMISFALWFWSFYLLSKWKKLSIFFISNMILIAVYVAILMYGKTWWGHYEYGLGFLLRLGIALLSHVLIVFVFALIKNNQISRSLESSIRIDS